MMMMIIIIIIIIMDCRAQMIPVRIRATGTSSKSLRQYLSNIEGKHDIEEIQTKAILGTVTYCGKY